MDIATLVAFGIIIIILIYSIFMKIFNPLEAGYGKLLIGTIFVFLAYAVIVFIKWRAM